MGVLGENPNIRRLELWETKEYAISMKETGCVNGDVISDLEYYIDKETNEYCKNKAIQELDAIRKEFSKNMKDISKNTDADVDDE